MLNVSLHKPTQANTWRHGDFVTLGIADEKGSGVVLFIDDRATAMLILGAVENAMKMLDEEE